MEILYYFFLFITLYFQVFFLVSYLEDSEYYETKNEIPNISLDFFPLVSIIVACWNEENTIEHTVESLLSLDYPHRSLQIIVVNDGSSDGTLEKMQKYKNHPSVLLLSKENGGKFTAINEALPYCKGEFIATVDADTLLEKNALTIMVKTFLDDPDLSALGSTILIREPKTFIQKAQMVEYQMFSFTKLLLARMNGALVVPGAFSMYRRDVFDRIGGFKHAHLLEDLELTFRMQKAGLKVGQSKEAFAYTKGPENIFTLFKQRLRWSYGFLMNSYDYRSMLKGKQNLHFGWFTLPMSLFSYLTIPVASFTTLYLFIKIIIEKIQKIQLLGWKNTLSLSKMHFDFFSLQAMFFISLIIYIIVLFIIFSGKKIARDNSKNPFPLILFFIVYALLVPLWVIKSLYQIIFSKKVAWR